MDKPFDDFLRLKSGLSLIKRQERNLFRIEMDNLEKKIENLDDHNKFYVTTPIYYVTAKPHIGSVYSSILADVVSRWNKLQGKKTFFLTGTDEHGQKVAKAAENAGKSPKEFVDSFIPAYQNAFKDYEIDYDYFIRTTDPEHEKAVQVWLKMLLDKDEIYKGSYDGYYCAQCELFVKEKDGASENSNENKNLEKKEAKVLCPDCNRETEIVSEECYFFRLSKYQDKLLKFYEENPDIIAPKERLNEVISFLKSGLKDLSISRTKISWGIPFPGDDKHVAYVWADALNNYITAIGWGQDDAEKKKEFDFWWPADLHIMGKDILRFHAIYWPAFLMASGLKLPKRMLVHGWITVDKKKMSKSFGNVIDPIELQKIYGNEPVRYYLVRQMAINQDGDFSIEDLEQRISSDLANDLGNLLNRMVALAQKNEIIELNAPEIWSESAIELRDMAQNTVSDFQTYMADYQFHMALASLWKFINKVNSYFHTQEPWKLAKTDREAFLQVLSATGHSLEVIAILLWPVMPKKMEKLLGSLGLTFDLGENLIEKLSLGNWDKKFIFHKIDTLFVKPEPRDPSINSGRTGENDSGSVLSSIGKVGRTEENDSGFVLSSMSSIGKVGRTEENDSGFVLSSIGKVGRTEENDSGSVLSSIGKVGRTEENDSMAVSSSIGKAGRTGERESMSEDVKVGQENISRAGESNAVKKDNVSGVVSEARLEPEHIGIEDFVKTHLVVGQIETAEIVEGSDKLLKLMVDCGAYGRRQVFSGVRKYYKPEELVGKQGVFVVNLKPRKIMGQESQGMMLFAQDDAGNFKFTTVSGFVKNGTRLS
ncbi:MAG: Methionyl-tRNA synthetase [candidate division TM6 bacterium GW2011_GWF2_30_66]|nr:MAG: Methionyl-tRNA synthetase [candidate division TM6 bacterium GW2011_GWF2_30_66]